jgi:hypothetical protein
VGTSLEVFVGYYRPFGHFDPASIIDHGTLPEQPSGLSAVAWGATGHMGVGGRFGFAAQLAATLDSRVRAIPTPDGRTHGPTDATVSMGVLQAQFVRHSGDAYRQYGSPTSLAAAFGTTITVPIRAHWELIADATTLFYAFRMSTPSDIIGADMEHGNQRDAMLHLGLGWTHH